MGWGKVVEEIVGVGYLEVSVTPAADSYPAMVVCEVEPSTMLADDARNYALALLAAAEEADAQTEAMVTAAFSDAVEARRA